MPETPSPAQSTAAAKQRVFFPFEEFDREKIQWSRWQKRLESAFTINDTPTDKKVFLLLHHMGSATYNTLCDKISPDEPEKKTYDEVCKVLAELFDPKPLEIVENYRFHLSRQLEHQSVDDFLIELKKVAMHCKFDTYLNTALRNQFVFGMKSAAIRNRLLENTDLTLEKALQTARQMELSNKGNAEISHNLKEVSFIAHNKKNRSHDKKVNNNNNNNASNSSSEKQKARCYRCGGEHSTSKCNRTNLYCKSCKLKGHIQAVCITSKKKAAQQQQKAEANSTEINNVEELCHISAPEAKHKQRDKYWINLQINSSSSLDFEIDSGSPVAIVSKADYERNIGKINYNELHPSDINLVSYTGGGIKVYGFVVSRHAFT